jgi:hypothetical protein
MEQTDPFGHEERPAASAAAQIEAFGAFRQGIERENGEILVEMVPELFRRQLRLVEGCPFFAEPLDSLQVNVRAGHDE